MVKIYGQGRSRWLKCIWMAQELGIDFEEVRVAKSATLPGFGDQQYRDLNPFGLIPALEDRELKLFESQAIVNYLGEKYPEKALVPKSGTLERAVYDQWTYFCVGTLEAPLASWFKHTFIFDEETKNLKEKERAGKELKRHLDTLNDVIADKKFLVGDRFSAADITMTYTLSWVNSCGLLGENKHLQNYIETHLSRECYPRNLK